ncbi:MAG: diacylglycerol kinase family protein [Clostridia bacterium]|nr:diacylglycerol kinase family protein [Clostridia bacterium]
MNKIKNEPKKIVNSFKYAISGIITGFKEERNMKIHILAVVIVVILGIVLKISKTEWIICLILFGVVISAELFNTAIETVVDIAMPEINEKARIAKDVSAGAVLIQAIISAIIGIIIFAPKIVSAFTNLI